MSRIQKADGFENQYLFVLQKELCNAYLDDPLFPACLITDIGFFPTARHHFRSRPQGSGEAILLLCVAGEGYCRLGEGQSLSIGAGEGIVLPPGVAHEYGAAEQNPWSVYWVHFQGKAESRLQSLWRRQAPIRLDGTDVQQAISLFRRCFALLKMPWQQEEYFAVCQYVLAVLAMVRLAQKQASLPITPKGDQAIQKALEFMKQNLHQSVTLRDIAAAASFSASHLNALFKTATGHPPMDYFLRMKIQAASKALYFTDRPVKEIAGDYGIFDSCYFSRLFKKVMGTSPLGYRNLAKG